MSLILLLFSTCYVFLAFLTTPEQNSNNPFSQYFTTEIHAVMTQQTAFLTFSLVLTIFYIHQTHWDKNYPYIKKFLIGAIHVLLAAVFGIVLSFFLLLVIACIELNLLAILINTNPHQIGAITERAEIVKTLKQNNLPPEIIEGDYEQQKMATAVGIAATGKTNLFGKIIIPSIPTWIVFPIQKPTTTLMLIDNTLVVTGLQNDDAAAISPVIGYLYVKQYFPTRKIKADPTISILTQNEYIANRRIEAAKNIIHIDTQLTEMQATQASLSATINETKKRISDTENKLQGETVQADNTYRTCLGKGQKPAVCKNIKSEFTSIITNTAQTVTTLNNNLLLYDSQFKQNSETIDLLRTQRKVLKTLSNNIPHELGLFEPPHTIKIIFDTQVEHPSADYFATLIHEYLHYASYVSSEKHLADSFFEEGLTEYFTRKTIQNDLNTTTNIGYPVLYKIIDQMTQSISESDFAEIYFTKDQALLETTINRVYGENFYKENQLTFTAIQFSSNTKQTLKLANTIMKKIGGKALQESDLISSYNN